MIEFINSVYFIFIYIYIYNDWRGKKKERISGRIKDTRDNIGGKKIGIGGISGPLLRDVSLTILLSIASVISRPVNDNYPPRTRKKFYFHRLGEKLLNFDVYAPFPILLPFSY